MYIHIVCYHVWVPNFCHRFGFPPLRQVMACSAVMVYSSNYIVFARFSNRRMGKNWSMMVIGIIITI